MNRKDFLYRTTLLSLAATSLPRIARALQTSGTMDNYLSSHFHMGKGEYAYGISLPADRAVSELEEITLVLFEYEEGSSTSSEQTKYRLKKNGKVAEDGAITILNLKNEGKISGDASLPAGFPKKLRLKVSAHEQLWLETSKDMFTSLAWQDPSDSECFLTTACTLSRGLPDDCMELMTLRAYRDRYLRQSRSGEALVDAYYDLGPRIVKAIDSHENRLAIYEELYHSLVLPSVEMIKEERLEDARDYYRAYVENLEEIFLA